MTLTSISDPFILALMAVSLVVAIIMAVHHAEVVAHRLGEPYGTLVLAVCVTVIEVALIVSIMLAESKGAELIARDAVFAAIMIVVNGVVGLSILIGGIRHHELSFRIEGSNAALTVLVALATLTLVLPNFTTSSTGPTYTDSQLIFAGLCSLVLYGTFVFVQTVRHRDYFLPVNQAETGDKRAHAPAPSKRRAIRSAVLLVLSLIAVVTIAKLLSSNIESMVRQLGAPQTLVGVIIALLVLAPESIAAIRAAMANRLQTSFNLALGSALASIGLTIPTVAVLSVAFELPINLGIDAVSMVLLVMTMLASITTLATGKTAVLQGVVHLVIFAVYIFLVFQP